jgi:hypothetical protein
MAHAQLGRHHYNGIIGCNGNIEPCRYDVEVRSGVASMLEDKIDIRPYMKHS